MNPRITSFSDIVDFYKYGSRYLYNEYVPDCIKEFSMPRPAYGEHICDLKFIPYIVSTLVDNTIDKIKDMVTTVTDECIEVGKHIYYGYPEYIVMKKLKNIHNIPELLSLVELILAEYNDSMLPYVKLRVCDRTLRELLDQLSGMDQNTYTVNASLVFYMNYQPEDGLSPTSILQVTLTDQNNAVTIITKPCFSLTIKTKTTYDANHNLIFLTYIDRNRFK